MNWQPIETAPKDQSEILILQWKRIYHAQWGDDFHKTWIGVGHNGFFDHATHWMPLPEFDAEEPGARVPIGGQRQ